MRENALKTAEKRPDNRDETFRKPRQNALPRCDFRVCCNERRPNDRDSYRQEKWEGITFDTVLLDHYWLPDSVAWLKKGYMVSGEILRFRDKSSEKSSAGVFLCLVFPCVIVFVLTFFFLLLARAMQEVEGGHRVCVWPG